MLPSSYYARMRAFLPASGFGYSRQSMSGLDIRPLSCCHGAMPCCHCAMLQRCHGVAISRSPHVLLITCNARAHAARAALPLAPCFHLLITHACELSFLLQASDTAASPCLALTFAHFHAATTRCHAATAPCYNDAMASPSHAALMFSHYMQRTFMNSC